MPLKDSANAYGLVSILFHWVIALGYLGLFGLGWYMVTLDYYDPLYTTLPHWHKSLGVLLCIVVLARFAWRAFVSKPAPLASLKRWEVISSRMAHVTLLLGTIVVLASGYLIPTAEGEGIEVFNWFISPAIELGMDNQEDLSGQVHWIAAYLILGVAALHALAALKHQFLDRDRTLLRMIVPSRTAEPDTKPEREKE